MKRNIPLPNTPSIMSCQTTTPSLQSMRDLLSTEIYKYQSRELLNKLQSMKKPIQTKQPIPDKSIQTPSSILDYSFLNPSSASNRQNSMNSYSNSSSSRNDKQKQITKNKSTTELIDYQMENVFSHSATTSNRSNSRGNRDIYQRQMAMKLKKDMQLEQLRQKKIKEEIKEIKDKPTINSKSKKLSKNKPPLIKRISQIEQKTKEKLQKIQNELIEQEKEDISPEISTKNKGEFEDFDEWIQKNEKWNNKRIAKIDKLKEEIKEFENDDELTFQPEINKNSEKIIKEKGKPLSMRLSYVKESREEFVKRKLDELLPSFQPKINKNYQIDPNYYEFMNEDQEKLYNSLYR